MAKRIEPGRSHRARLQRSPIRGGELGVLALERRRLGRRQLRQRLLVCPPRLADRRTLRLLRLVERRLRCPFRLSHSGRPRRLRPLLEQARHTRQRVLKLPLRLVRAPSERRRRQQGAGGGAKGGGGHLVDEGGALEPASRIGWAAAQQRGRESGRLQLRHAQATRSGRSLHLPKRSIEGGAVSCPSVVVVLPLDLCLLSLCGSALRLERRCRRRLRVALGHCDRGCGALLQDPRH